MREEHQIIDVSHALSELPALINGAVQEAETHARGAMTTALRVGVLLRQAKDMLPHGVFAQWITTNCIVAVRTAQAYMRLAKHCSDLPPAEAQRVAQLPVRDAVRAIATAPTTPMRHAGVRLATRSQIQRTETALRKSADELRRAAKEIQTGRMKGKQLAALRNKLTLALSAVDRLAAGEAPDA